MKNKFLTIGILVVAMLFIAGCGGNSDLNSYQETSNNPEALKQDLCAVFTPAEIGQIVGQTVTLNRGLLPQTDIVQGCAYEMNDGKSINFIVYKNVSEEGSKTAFDSVLKTMGEQTKLAGLGQDAVYFESSFVTNLTTYQKNIFITMSSTIGKADQRMKNIKSLAALIWGKLL